MVKFFLKTCGVVLMVTMLGLTAGCGGGGGGGSSSSSSSSAGVSGSGK